MQLPFVPRPQKPNVCEVWSPLSNCGYQSMVTGGDLVINIKRSEAEAIRAENKIREEMKLPARSSE
jgi:hypothetical protein